MISSWKLSFWILDKKMASLFGGVNILIITQCCLCISVGFGEDEKIGTDR
jgi:hypothetical protein